MTDRPVVTVSISSTDPKYTAAASAIIGAGLLWLDHNVLPFRTGSAADLDAGSVRDFRAAGGSFAIRRSDQPVAEPVESIVTDVAALVAEADGVRKATETLTAIVARATNAGGNWYGDVAAPALAALKSTAAKEQPPSVFEFANMVARIRKDGETAGGISNDAALDQLEKVIGFARSIVGDPGYPDLDNLPDLEEPTPDPERHPES